MNESKTKKVRSKGYGASLPSFYKKHLSKKRKKNTQQISKFKMIYDSLKANN